MKNWKQTILTGLFVVLYAAVGFVSVYHAVTFFGIANEPWLATMLACAFEIGQMCVTVYVLIKKSKEILPWSLMSILTGVQIIGNIFASYRYMIEHSKDQIQYFIDSVMWFMKDPDPQVNIVILSYVIGAILPIVALLFTALIVKIWDDAPSKIDVIDEDNMPHSDPKIFL